MPWDGSTKGHTDAARCIRVICTRHNTAYKLSLRIQILGTNWLSLDSPDRLPVALCRIGRTEVAVTWLELASSEVAYLSSTWLVRDNWVFFSCVGLVVVLPILLWTGPPSLIMPCAYFWWQSAGARNNPSAWNQVLSVSIQWCLGKTASAIWLEGGTRVNPLPYGWLATWALCLHECMNVGCFGVQFLVQFIELNVCTPVSEWTVTTRGVPPKAQQACSTQLMSTIPLLVNP